MNARETKGGTSRWICMAYMIRTLTEWMTALCGGVIAAEHTTIPVEVSGRNPQSPVRRNLPLYGDRLN